VSSQRVHVDLNCSLVKAGSLLNFWIFIVKLVAPRTAPIESQSNVALGSNSSLSLEQNVHVCVIVDAGLISGINRMALRMR
jgi:hypothetical protein